MKQMKSAISSMVAMFTLVAMIFGMSSCKDNDDKFVPPFLTIEGDMANNNKMAAAQAGSILTIKFDTNQKWHLESSDSWITFSPEKGGAGKQTVAITVLPNGGNARSAAIKLVSSVKNHEWVVEQAGKPVPPAAKEITLTQLREMYKGADLNLAEDITVRGVVINSMDNINSLKNLFIADDKAGIQLRLDADNKNAFKEGDELKVNLKGGVLKRYNGGGLQVELPLAQVSKIAEGKSIAPVKVTYAQLMSDKAAAFESRLVILSDVQFKTWKDTYKMAIYDKTKKQYKNTYNTLALDGASADSDNFRMPSIFVSGFASFAKEAAPGGNGTVTGVLNFSFDTKNKKGSYSIFIRNMKDINFNGPRK